MSADFLTRLIERSRGHMPLAQRIEPLIAPLYAKGNAAPVSDGLEEGLNSVTEPDFHDRSLAPRIPGTRWKEQNSSVTPSQPRVSEDNVARELRPALALTDEAQSSRLNPPASIEPLPQTTSNAALSPALPEKHLTGLITPAEKFRRANATPVAVRPQVVRAEDSGARAEVIKLEAPGETSAPVIRVTIGRVEVRAVNSPAPPARRSAPPAPKLPLEEYLRLRNGGKR